MSYKFWDDRSHGAAVRRCEFSNFVLSSTNYVVSGCNVSYVSGMTVNIALGVIFINDTEVNISAANKVISNGDGSYPRLDLILINGSGVISVVEGTPSVSPTTPSYVEESFVCIGMVYVPTNATTISADEIENIGIIGSSGSGGAGTDTDFIPDIDNTYDIGSATYRWKDAYFGNQVYITTSVNLKETSKPTNVASMIKLFAKTNGSGLYFRSASGTVTQVSVGNGMTLYYGTVSVGTTSTVIRNAAVTRLRLLLMNYSDTIIYIGVTGVTTSTGYRILPGETFEFRDGDAVYSVHGGSGSKDLRYLEVLQ